MKRLLYVLLAVALAGSAPGSVFRDRLDPDDDDASDTVIDVAARRPGIPLAPGTGLRLAPRDARPGDLILCLPDDGAVRRSPTASILVERRNPEVAEVRMPEDARALPLGTALRVLLDAVLGDCRSRGDLKVAVDLPIAVDDVAALARRHGFIPGRSHRRGGRLVHELYADLYSKRRDDTAVWQLLRDGPPELTRGASA